MRRHLLRRRSRRAAPTVRQTRTALLTAPQTTDQRIPLLAAQPTPAPERLRRSRHLLTVLARPLHRRRLPQVSLPSLPCKTKTANRLWGMLERRQQAILPKEKTIQPKIRHKVQPRPTLRAIQLLNPRQRSP